jgi:hypothetical protein
VADDRGVPGGDGFAVATGDGPPLGDGGRAAELRVAYEGLLQIRRLTRAGTADPVALPARWERLRPVRAVALLLEAAGFAPSALDAEGGRVATGYVVRQVEPGSAVRVEWLGPHGGGAAHDEERALKECAEVLGRHGWEALLYRGPRRRRYLEVEPADAGPAVRGPAS